MEKTKEVSVLNWYNKSVLVGDLYEIFGEANQGGSQRSFVTMRLGTKWADKLNPGDLVLVSVSDDLKAPNGIGMARVERVSKIFIQGMTDDELKMNIGAKTRDKIVYDMQTIYADEEITVHSVVSVIELSPEAPEE